MDSTIIQKKSFRGLVISAAFIAGGILLILQSDLIYHLLGSLLLVFGIIGLAMSFLSIIGVHNVLVLTQEGFSVLWLGYSPAHWKLKWEDVVEFVVTETQPPKVPGTSLPVGRRTTKIVGIIFTPSKQASLPTFQLKRMNLFRERLRCDEILPGAFGMSVESLVLELNDWKSKIRDAQAA